MTTETYLSVDFYRVNNDVNGNPRFVVHFLDLLTEQEKENTGILDGYEIAHRRALKLGGKVYRGRDFGGGFVFQTYSTFNTAKQIKESLNTNF